MNNQHQADEKAYREYAFDTTAQPLKTWLQKRLKRNQRDGIDNLARRIIVDVRVPNTGSISIFRSHLRHRGYSADDQATFEAAWQEMRTQQLERE